MDLRNIRAIVTFNSENLVDFIKKTGFGGAVTALPYQPFATRAKKSFKTPHSGRKSANYGIM